jgi:hypothetical protein
MKRLLNGEYHPIHLFNINRLGRKEGPYDKWNINIYATKKGITTL